MWPKAAVDQRQLKWKACPVHRWLPGTQIQALLHTLLDYNPFVHLATLWTCCFSMLKPADPKDHRLPSFFIIIDFEERGENRETVKESKKEKHWFVVSLIDEFIAWFLYVTWSGTEPATLAFQEGRLSKRATQPGQTTFLSPPVRASSWQLVFRALWWQPPQQRHLYSENH